MPQARLTVVQVVLLGHTGAAVVAAAVQAPQAPTATVAQHLQQPGRQHDIAVFLSLALLDANALAIDSFRLQAGRLRNTQAGGIACRQDCLVLEALDAAKEVQHLLGVSCGDQLGYPDQIVGDQVEQEVASDADGASMFGLAHGSVLLAPAEDALGHGTACLRHAVAVVSGGSSVDGALASVRIVTVVLGHMGRDVHRSQLGHMVGGVIGLVFADGDATAVFLGLGLEHLFRGAPLGCSCGMRDRPSTARRDRFSMVTCPM